MKNLLKSRYKFRGFTKQDELNQWVHGSLVVYNSENVQIVTPSIAYFVEHDSVGLSLDGDLYEGDIFVVPGEYPFFDDDGDNNYLGVIEYVPDDGYCAWYYGLAPISDKVRGGACGGAMADLEDKAIKVVGNLYENKSLLEREGEVTR